MENYFLKNRKINLVLLLISTTTLSLAQTEDKIYLLGQFNPQRDKRFVKLKDEHTAGSARGGVLRKETYEAFIQMAAAAKKDCVSLKIISATRNFDSQKRIWENKWTGKTIVEGKNLTTILDEQERAKIILHYSSMPGSSRHHWGTDFDLNNLENAYFENGQGLKIYLWLKTYAAQFGFCQPYTSKTNGTRTGYEEEKWHWSYLPLSSKFLAQYKKEITDKDYTDFKGSKSAKRVHIIENYVMGVACE